MYGVEIMWALIRNNIFEFTLSEPLPIPKPYPEIFCLKASILVTETTSGGKGCCWPQNRVIGGDYSPPIPTGWVENWLGIVSRPVFSSHLVKPGRWIFRTRKDKIKRIEGKLCSWLKQKHLLIEAGDFRSLTTLSGNFHYRSRCGRR